MSSARIFAQHLYSQNPQASLCLLTLYNYVKNVSPAQTPLNAQLLNDFYDRALCFQHWRKNRSTLAHTVREALNSFFRHHREFETSPIVHADHRQVIEIEDLNQFLLLTERVLKSQTKEHEQIRLKADSPRSLVVIHLYPDGRLRVRQLSPLAYISKGELLPLLQGMDLHYSPSLELATDQQQNLKIDSFSSTHFSQASDQLNGVIVRGYTFHRVEVIKTDHFKRAPKIFMPLKRIERHFIDPQTDPFYVRLSEDLEKAVKLLQNNQLNAIHYACSVFERGRLAVEEVFPDDKLLSLLVKDLGNTLVIKTEANRHQEPSKSSSSQPRSTALKQVKEWQNPEPQRRNDRPEKRPPLHH